MTIYSGFSHWKWWFSIAMLVYQRVGGFVHGYTETTSCGQWVCLKMPWPPRSPDSKGFKVTLMLNGCLSKDGIFWCKDRWFLVFTGEACAPLDCLSWFTIMLPCSSLFNFSGIPDRLASHGMHSRSWWCINRLMLIDFFLNEYIWWHCAGFPVQQGDFLWYII